MHPAILTTVVGRRARRALAAALAAAAGVTGVLINDARAYTPGCEVKACPGTPPTRNDDSRLPDLFISRVVRSWPGGSYVTVKNIGTASTVRGDDGWPVTGESRLWVYNEDGGRYYYVPALNAGESYQVTLTGGSQNCSEAVIYADSDDRILELNESNNRIRVPGGVC